MGHHHAVYAGFDRLLERRQFDGFKARHVAGHLRHTQVGVGGGVAIPHARLKDLQRPYGLFARLKQPIEFDAIDVQPVDLVFVLLLPAAEENGQLGALALVARTLRPREVRDRLRAAKNASELYSVIGS